MSGTDKIFTVGCIVTAITLVISTVIVRYSFEDGECYNPIGGKLIVNHWVNFIQLLALLVFLFFVNSNVSISKVGALLLMSFLMLVVLFKFLYYLFHIQCCKGCH
jgi:hypothetical protein